MYSVRESKWMGVRTVHCRAPLSMRLDKSKGAWLAWHAPAASRVRVRVLYSLILYFSSASVRRAPLIRSMQSSHADRRATYSLTHVHPIFIYVLPAACLAAFAHDQCLCVCVCPASQETCHLLLMCPPACLSLLLPYCPSFCPPVHPLRTAPSQSVSQSCSHPAST